MSLLKSYDVVRRPNYCQNHKEKQDSNHGNDVVGTSCGGVWLERRFKSFREDSGSSFSEEFRSLNSHAANQSRAITVRDDGVR